MYQLLQSARNEKDIENAYRAELLRVAKGGRITSPYKTDGLFEMPINGNGTKARTLLEFKYDTELKSPLSRAGVLVQCLYYLRRFQAAGEQLPSTILVADQNECFVIHTNAIAGYLTDKIDWNIAASEASKRNPDLVSRIATDPAVTPFVYEVNTRFSLREVLEKIIALTKNTVRLVLVSRFNVQAIFDYFSRNILDTRSPLTPNQKAHVFIDVLINPDENYLHPKKPNTLVTKTAGDVRVNAAMFRGLFSHIKAEYTIREKEDLVANVDMLVEMETRRFKGEFFTPDLVALEADRYLTAILGDDYKDKYVVWDCAWGTGNLTKHHRYAELYASTLEKCDLETADQMGINPEATKFQFDFLNDDLDNIPPGLKAALVAHRPILFFINPPFGTANNAGAKGTSKQGMAQTRINVEMKMAGWGSAAQQLYSQFLYRIWAIREKYSLNQVAIGVYSVPLYLSGEQFREFRKKFFSDFAWKNGFLVHANTFSDIKSEWGIIFSVWENGRTTENSFPYDVLQPAQDGLGLEKVMTKCIYNTDQLSDATRWVKEFTKGVKTVDAPQMSSGINVKEDGAGRIIDGALGFFASNSNNVYMNTIGVSLFSSAGSRGHGYSVTPENFWRVISFFTARKLVIPDYINCKDEYLVPDEGHPLYPQWQKDCLIYVLFNNSSNQSALRQIEYKGRLWDIRNEFFWMDKQEMLDVADQHGFEELYYDAKFSTERYVYRVLHDKPGIYAQLSPDARLIIDTASNLVLKSFPWRKLLHQEHPDWHLHTWDAGWYQIKLVLKNYFKNDLDAFNRQYKCFEERLRPLVYEMGFLRN